MLIIQDAQKSAVHIDVSMEKEEATIIDQRKAAEVKKVVKVFDTVKVQIRAEMVEYRRTVSLVLLL